MYVNVDQKDQLEKLTDMFIPLLTVKGFITHGKEELVNYTLRTVERLCQKMPSLITIKRFYMISKLLSEGIKLSSREYLCNLLSIIPDSQVQKSITYVRNMNKIKKGFATATLDYDKAITNATEFQDKILPTATFDESVAILFQVIHFLNSSELSLRVSATSLLDSFIAKYYKDIIDYSNQDMKPESEDLVNRSKFISLHLIPSIRSIINTKTEELLLKATFKILKRYLQCIRDLYSNENLEEILKELKVPKEYLDLACVIDEKDENADFFENILNIKLQRRYKAIRLLCKKLEDKEIQDLKTLTKIILPIADMFILRMSQAQSSTRGVVSYAKQNLEQINNE